METDKERRVREIREFLAAHSLAGPRTPRNTNSTSTNTLPKRESSPTVDGAPSESTPIMLRQPKKLMLAGDWHGNLPWAFKAIAYAKSEGVDTILHVGDFGWWTHTPAGEQYLNEVDAELSHYGIELYFVDGNHEFHPGLNNSPDATPHWDINWPTIKHLPRGFRWEWWDQTWMALGGAHSVDRRALTPGKDWWPEEWLTDEQIEYACRPGPVDVIVAHDAPAGVGIPGINDAKSRTRKWNPQMFPPVEMLKGEEHRDRLRTVVDEKYPIAYFHGHYHVAYQSAYRLPGGFDHMMVRGLDKDGSTMGRNTYMVTKGFDEE